MEHYFELPVVYQGKERNFKGRLVTFGYVYKFYIVVNGRELIFEKDDDQQYRVLAPKEDKDLQAEPRLIQTIISSLNSL